MAMMITDECIVCDVCLPECPNNAISEGEQKYMIDPDFCTECVGVADAPQCADVCPADCVVKDPKHVETKEQLIKKKDKVHINW